MPTARIDPLSRQICFFLTAHQLKVIDIDPVSGRFSEAVNMSLRETGVIDFDYLHGCQVPTIALLHRDDVASNSGTVTGHRVNTATRQLEPTELRARTNNRPLKLITLPQPVGGAVVLCYSSISYCNLDNDGIAITTRPAQWTAFGAIDANGSRYLVGDLSGSLSVLLIGSEGAGVPSLTLEELGKACVPSSIAYLSDRVAFIASSLGDSMLIRLRAEKDEEGSFVEQLLSYSNIGPLTDMAAVDLDRQGQCELVCCSGAFSEGSVCVVRNGVGLNVQASVEMPAINGIWCLKGSQQFDTHVVLALIGATRVLKMTGEELEELESSEFERVQTIFAADFAGHMLLAGSDSLRLLEFGSFRCVAEWRAPQAITRCDATATQLLVACGTLLCYVQFDQGQFVVRSQIQLPHEIAALCCQPLRAGENSTALCSVGLWNDRSVRVFTLPELKEVLHEPLGQVLPRSVLLIELEGTCYLLVGLADGHLVALVLAQDLSIAERKRVPLGTTPLQLSVFSANSKRHVMASCDRPTVVSSSNRRLLYSSLNTAEIAHAAQFNSESFPECLALATQDSFVIGSLDDILKLHVHKYRFDGEFPRRIAYHAPTHSFVVGMRSTAEPSSDSVVLASDQNFELGARFQFEANEKVQTVKCARVANHPSPLIAVGTGFSEAGESESRRGRLLLFTIDDGRLIIEAQLDTEGSVHAVAEFGGRLVCSANGSALLLELSADGSDRRLNVLAAYQGLTLITAIDTHPPFIALFDLMRSATLLHFSEDDGALVDVATDFEPNWVTSGAFVDSDNLLCGENNSNLFTLHRNTDADTEEVRYRLQTSGLYHLGSMVNRLCFGSLVMALPELPHYRSALACCTDGSIVVVAMLPPDVFELFEKIERALVQVVQPIGGLGHEDYRAFSSVRKTLPRKGFVDGDLVETLLDLPPEKVAAVAELVKLTPHELLSRVETMARCLH